MRGDFRIGDKDVTSACDTAARIGSPVSAERET
jgi:hypothetical protein